MIAASDSNPPLTKDAVFCIMGKYYGNACYRDAIRVGISAHDLLVIKELLDEINALGYAFADLHRLYDTEDPRFVPILLKHLPELESENLQAAVFQYIRFKTYGDYVPEIAALYQNPRYEAIRFDIGQSLYHLYQGKYKGLYLHIASAPGYEERLDMVIEALCKRKVPEALPQLLRIYQKRPEIWAVTFLQYIGGYRNPTYLAEVEKYLDAEDPELRRLAQKAQKLLQQAENGAQNA